MPNLARGVSPGRAPKFEPRPAKGVTGSSAPKPNVGPWKAAYGAQPKAPPPKPQAKAPSVFAQSLQKAAQQNIRTGGQLQQYRGTPEGHAYVEHQRLQKAASTFEKLFGNQPSQKQLEQ